MEHGTATPAKGFIKAALAKTTLAVRIAALAALVAGAAGCTGESSTPRIVSPTAAPTTASTPAASETAVPTATPTFGTPGPFSCSGSDRLVTVTNLSGRKIWVAALGSTDTTAPDPTSCTNHSDCVANEFCNSLVSPPQCSSVPLAGTITYQPSSPTCASNSDCTDATYPVCYTGNSQCGSIATDGNGFALANGPARERKICVPTTWGGRLWARTGCNFTENGNTTCAGSCQGQTVTVGAPCALSSDCQDACVGGFDNGHMCTTDSDCPGMCQDTGTSCTSDSDCTSGSHVCNLATCGKAFCQAGASCCASGSCTGAQLTCSGGSSVGNLCTSAADCPGVCVAGANKGSTCTTNSDCGTGGACSVGSCGANTFSLYCAGSGAAPATLAELTLAAPGVCSGGSKSGGPCGSACTNGGGTCGDTTHVVAQSDFFDIQAGIDGPDLPAVITPVSGTYQITADLRGVDVNTTTCASASDCSGTAPYSQCFSPPFNRKIFGPKEALCARSCSSDSNCTTAPYTKCFQAPSPFENLSPGICIRPCTSDSQCTGVSGDTVCDKQRRRLRRSVRMRESRMRGRDLRQRGPAGRAVSVGVQLERPGPGLSLLSQDFRREGQVCRMRQRVRAVPAGCGTAGDSGLRRLHQPFMGTDQHGPLLLPGRRVVLLRGGRHPGQLLRLRYLGEMRRRQQPGTFCGNDADCAGGGTCSAMPLPQGQATPGFAAASGSGTWLTQAEPYTRKFKAGCPTAYAYQYDDSTSTFVCGGVSASKETAYKVTFMAPTAAPTPTP